MWGLLLILPAFALGWWLGKRKKTAPTATLTLTEADKKALRDFERFMRYDGFVD